MDFLGSARNRLFDDLYGSLPIRFSALHEFPVLHRAHSSRMGDMLCGVRTGLSVREEGVEACPDRHLRVQHLSDLVQCRI